MKTYPGLDFEGFYKGQEFDKLPVFVISQRQLNVFAELTGDKNPLHTDLEFCKEGLFGRPVVHGVGTLSFIMGVLDQAGIFRGSCTAFLGMEEVKFLKPVYPGIALWLKAVVIDKRDTPQQPSGSVTFQLVLEDSNGKALLTAKLRVLIARRQHNNKESAGFDQRVQ